MIRALDVDADGRAVTLLQHLRIEHVEAFHRRHVGQAQILVADGRQDADHRQHRIHAMRHLLAAVPGGQQRFLHGCQHARAHFQRRRVQFDVEAGEFGHHQRIVQRAQIGLVDRIGEAAVIEQPGFEFESRHVAGIGETAGSGE